MKALRYIGLLACLAILGPWADANYSLVWNDEFDYTGLPDSSKWNYDVGGSGWGNNELQYYTADRLENARVGDGFLTITAIREPYQGSQYTSARLVSRNKGDWTYGRFEIRAKLPRGRGTWPAIWMLPTDWAYGGWPSSGEIDIMEHVGYDMDVVHATVHTQSYNHTLGTQQGSSIRVDNVDTTFHVYAIEWRPDRIDGYVDGQIYFSFSNQETGHAEWPFDKRFHLLLNIAIGGNWGGAQGVDNSIFPQEMVVDYVRVYAIEDFGKTIPQVVPGRVEAESFSSQSGVRLEETMDSDGFVNAGYLSHNDWMAYDLDVASTGLYRLNLRGASPTGTTKLEIDAEGTQLTSDAFPATGGWQTWRTSAVADFEMTKGPAHLKFTINAPLKDDLNINWLQLELLEARPGLGYGIFEEYPMEDFWINTGYYLGWANVQHYPWVYIDKLDRYAYAQGQWFYLPR